MSEQLKIKISIADRVYPLTIQAKQEEGLRKAAKKIEQMIEKFEQSYAVRDKQDVLAMCALQFASQTEQNMINNDAITTETEQKLNSINEFLNGMIG
jgi:cell division protein ZapA